MLSKFSALCSFRNAESLDVTPRLRDLWTAWSAPRLQGKRARPVLLTVRIGDSVLEPGEFLHWASYRAGATGVGRRAPFVGRMTLGVSLRQQEALRLLGPALSHTAYLAGGVAIALTFLHRTSRDLDFFVPEDFDSERLAEHLQKWCMRSQCSKRPRNKALSSDPHGPVTRTHYSGLFKRWPNTKTSRTPSLAAQHNWRSISSPPTPPLGRYSSKWAFSRSHSPSSSTTIRHSSRCPVCTSKIYSYCPSIVDRGSAKRYSVKLQRSHMHAAAGAWSGVCSTGTRARSDFTKALALGCCPIGGSAASPARSSTRSRAPRGRRLQQRAAAPTPSPALKV